MLKNLNFRVALTILLISTVVFTAVVSINSSNSTVSKAKTLESSDKELLEFLKEGYNVYWYLDESLDKDNTVLIENIDYLRVVKNFYSKEDLNRYFSKFYTKKATENIMETIKPKFVEGKLYVLAGEAGDKPCMDTGVIVDKNIKENYITLNFKDSNNENIYLRANIKIDNGIMKIESWKVL